MDITFTTKMPKYLLREELERGKVYRRYNFQGQQWVASESYYIAGNEQHGDHIQMVNLRTGGIIADHIYKGSAFVEVQAAVSIGENVA